MVFWVLTLDKMHFFAKKKCTKIEKSEKIGFFASQISLQKGLLPQKVLFFFGLLDHFSSLEQATHFFKLGIGSFFLLPFPPMFSKPSNGPPPQKSS